MGYSIKVSHKRDYSSHIDPKFGEMVKQYADAGPAERDKMRRSLLEKVGGRGLEQIVKAAQGSVELVYG